MRRTVLTFGLISGGILALMMALTFPFHEQLGWDAAEIIGYASMVAAFLLVFFGIRSYRDTVAGGSLTLGQGFKVGALIVFVASLFYVAAWQIVYYGFDGDRFMERYETHILVEAREEGASQEEIDRQLADMRRWAELYRNPLVNIAFTFIEPLPVGLLFALVSAAMLRRRTGAPGDPGAPPSSVQASTH